MKLPPSASLYLVAPARLRAGPLAELVPLLAEAGVDVVQLREKEMEAAEVIAEAGPVAAACRAAGIPFLVNDRPDIALAVGADGVHLGRGDVAPDIARRILPDAIIGRSNHSGDDIARSLYEDVDYLAAGPVWETPTKPGRAAAGLELIARAAATIPDGVPWFAIGGITPDNLPEVTAAGATRVVVVRAVTEAEDPVAEVRRLKAHLY